MSLCRAFEEKPSSRRIEIKFREFETNYCSSSFPLLQLKLSMKDVEAEM